MEVPENKFIVRPYKPSDNAIVWELHKLGLNQMGADYGVGPWDEDLNQIEEIYIQNGGDFLIGEYDGKLVAMGALKRTTPEKAEIKRMRVHPDYQGKGLGQKVFEELEKKARELGFKTLHLDTTTKQVPAQKLYLKNGFQEVGREHLHGLVSILYEKTLA